MHVVIYKSRANTKGVTDMAYSLYGREVFRAEVNGTNYTFTCYTQNTSYGFRHICCEGFSNTSVCRYVSGDIIAKATYYNRTWEHFRYETVLCRAIQEQPKADQEQLKAILIDKTQPEEHEKCERELQVFQNLYNNTSDRFKEFAKDNIMIQNESDLQAVKGLMLLDSLLK